MTDAIQKTREELGMARLPRDDTGRVTSDYEPTPLEIEVARQAICREFGNNGTDGYYIRILKAIAAARASVTPADVGEELVAWRERDCDDEPWVYYDAASDVGEHIRDHQKDRHERDIFALYSATALERVVKERDKWIRQAGKHFAKECELADRALTAEAKLAEALARLETVEAETRERCAKVAQGFEPADEFLMWRDVQAGFAAAIRAVSQEKNK